LNGLRIKQQSFRQFAEQYKWNYILDNNTEDQKDEDDGEDDEDGIDVDKEDNAIISSPTTSNKKRKHNAIDVSVMVTPDDDNMVKPDMAKSYPYLSRALGGEEDGFDPTNPYVKRSMRGLLSELNELLSTEYQLDVNGISNNKISYVRVPCTQSDRSFLNSKEWVDTAIETAGSKQPSGTFESAKRITNHII